MTPTLFNNLLRCFLDLHSQYDEHYILKDSSRFSIWSGFIF
jgi:hypothetical protein